MKSIARYILTVMCRLMYPSFNVKAYHAGPWQVFTYGLMQKIVGFNRSVPWPVHFTSLVTSPGGITRKERASCPGFMPGCYIQGDNGIEIGNDTRIGPGVKIISANHDISDITRHITTTPVVIGDGCWIAANAVLLPGVRLGKHVIVGAGAVVTKSFEDGYCIIGGVPAKVIRSLDQSAFTG